MSNRTTEATNKIESIVSEICLNISLVEQDLATGVSSLNDSSNALHKTTQSFEVIDKDIINMATATKELINNIGNINENKENVISLINNILVMSKQNGEDVENVLPVILEENNMLENISSISKHLKELASSLDEISSAFITND